MLSQSGAECCYVYSTATDDEANAYARFFNPTVGIVEDPATGTAAGPSRLCSSTPDRCPAAALSRSTKVMHSAAPAG